MGKIYKNLEELIGNTPVVEFSRLSENFGCRGRIFAKLEWFNPCGSAKDRIAKQMIEEAEKAGLIKPAFSCIIEPTSGNTGIGLAAIGRQRGYRVVIVMPENMSEERKQLMRAHGAELVLTSAERGMSGAIEKARELCAEMMCGEDVGAMGPVGSVDCAVDGRAACLKAWIPDQFVNLAGPRAHYQTTGPEIWGDMDGEVDVLVCGVGTGGTLTGTGKYLKEKQPGIHIAAVEPAESAVLSGGPAGRHGIQGIGAGFVPEVLDRTVYDEIIAVETEDAYEMCRQLAKAEGFLVGISSGAALRAAVTVAQRPETDGKKIVVVLPDSGERYLSMNR